MNIPDTIIAGDSIKWRDDATEDVFGNAIDSPDWTLTYYLRTNAASSGSLTSVGATYQSGWEFTVTAANTTGLTTGTWYWQAIATKGSESITVGSGQLEVEATLSYTGTPDALDNRTQAAKDLDAVQAAIRAMVSGGAQEYTIGSRTFKKIELRELIRRESLLKAEVAREDRARMIANGLGDPHNLFVRF